jgi:hypothetical protein
MILYNPTDGDAFTTSISSAPKCCFLMTRLGRPVPRMVDEIRAQVSACCAEIGYRVIDANLRISGRDFLIKIWKMIAATPLAIGVLHEDLPSTTLANIFFELGVAQALGKETLIIKSPAAEVPSDFVRTEYLEFNGLFAKGFRTFLRGMLEQAAHYELVAEQLDRNPILALDYLKRAYLITGKSRLRTKARAILRTAGIENRAKNSVEILAAAF